MRIVVQRVTGARLRIGHETVASIGNGLVLLIGIGKNDTEKQLAFWANKCAHLRIFPDAENKMNLSVLDTGGEILAVSQFTLFGDARKGNRPSFTEAALPEAAEPLYERFVALLREKKLSVQTGRFGAMMEVEIHNTGPVTIILED